MPKGQFDPLAEQKLAVEVGDDVMRDRRRKYALPPGIVPGTPEYDVWMAEQHVLRNRLYQKKAYLKRRKIALALQKHEADHTTVEAALQEVDEQLQTLKEIRSTDVASVRTEASEVVIPFVDEMAKKYNISYKEAYEVMNADDYKGEESFTTKMASRLGDILKTPIRGEAD